MFGVGWFRYSLTSSGWMKFVTKLSTARLDGFYLSLTEDASTRLLKCEGRDGFSRLRKMSSRVQDFSSAARHQDPCGSGTAKSLFSKTARRQPAFCGCSVGTLPCQPSNTAGATSPTEYDPFALRFI